MCDCPQVAAVGLIFVTCWAAESALLLRTRNLFSNIVWMLTDDAARYSLAFLIADSVVFGAILIAVLVVLLRHSTFEFPGLRAVFISLVIIGNAFVYIGIGAQLYPILIQVTSSAATVRAFPDFLLLPILQDGYVPSPRSWMPWGSAMAGSALVVAFLTFFLWSLLKIRDYSEYEEIRSEVEVKYSLLGASPALLLRGTTTSARARKVAYLYFIPALCSIAVLGLLFRANVEFSNPQKRSDMAVVVLGALVGLLGFPLFGWSFYRVALLWLHIALSVVQALSTMGLMGFWLLWRLRFQDSTAPVPGFEIAVYTFGAVSVVFFFISAFYASKFVKWATPQLAGDVNVNVQNRMEYIYEGE